MAEFLLLNINHVWDSEDLITLVSLHGPDVERKYNMRIQKGDIVEVQPDGYWTNRPEVINPKNCVVSVPFVTYEQVKNYMDELYDENENTIKKRRYNIDLSQLTFENKVATIENVGQLNQLLMDKDNG